MDGTYGKVDDELANLVNKSFLAPMKDYLPLVDFSISFLQLASGSPLVITAASVFKKLSEVNPVWLYGLSKGKHWFPFDHRS